MSSPESAAPTSKPLSQLERLWRLAGKLRCGSWTLRELASALSPQVGEDSRAWLSLTRSVQRDLNALAKLESGFVRTPGRPPRYSIAAGPDPATLALWLAAAELLVGQLGGVHHQASLDNLRTLLPPEVRHRAAGPALNGVPDALRRREALTLEVAASAWWRGLGLRFEYPDTGHLERQHPGAADTWQTLTVQPQTIQLNPQTLALELRGGDSGPVYILSWMRAAQIVPYQSVPYQSVPYQSVPHQIAPHQSVPRNSRARLRGAAQPTTDLQLNFSAQVAPAVLQGAHRHLGELRLGGAAPLETRRRLAAGQRIPDDVRATIDSFGAEMIRLPGHESPSG